MRDSHTTKQYQDRPDVFTVTLPHLFLDCKHHLYAELSLLFYFHKRETAAVFSLN